MSNKFEQYTIDLGIIKAGNIYPITLRYTGDTQIIIVKASCGCTKPEYDNETKTLSAMYKPTPVPEHFKRLKQDHYVSIKSIFAIFDDQTTETITIKAIVKD